MTRGISQYAKQDDVIVTVPISRELHRDLKVVAAARGQSIKWLLTNAIKGIVIQHKDLIVRGGQHG